MVLLHPVLDNRFDLWPTTVLSLINNLSAISLLLNPSNEYLMISLSLCVSLISELLCFSARIISYQRNCQVWNHL